MPGKYGRVACDMLDWLKENGIKAGPVSQPSKKRPVVTVYNVRDSDREKIPKSFQRYEVELMSGRPEYDRNQLTDSITQSELLGD